MGGFECFLSWALIAFLGVQGVVLEGIPSKVVLLRNMVAPGEVDDNLEDEIAEELSKFWQVIRVLIFEVTEPNFPEHQAVRFYFIFSFWRAALCSISNSIVRQPHRAAWNTDELTASAFAPVKV